MYLIETVATWYFHFLIHHLYIGQFDLVSVREECVEPQDEFVVTAEQARYAPDDTRRVDRHGLKKNKQGGRGARRDLLEIKNRTENNPLLVVRSNEACWFIFCEFA